MTKRRKIVIAVIIFSLSFIALAVLAVNWLFVLRKAHDSFENYYAFRGCAQLLERTDDYGRCRTAAGKIIKIVKIQNRWFLESDGPGIW